MDDRNQMEYLWGNVEILNQVLSVVQEFEAAIAMNNDLPSLGQQMHVVLNPHPYSLLPPGFQEVDNTPTNAKFAAWYQQGREGDAYDSDGYRNRWSDTWIVLKGLHKVVKGAREWYGEKYKGIWM